MPRQVGEERRHEHDVEALSAREVGRIGGRSQGLNAELFGQEGERISLDLADRHCAGGQSLHEKTRGAAISGNKIQGVQVLWRGLCGCGDDAEGVA